MLKLPMSGNMSHCNWRFVQIDHVLPHFCDSDTVNRTPDAVIPA